MKKCLICKKELKNTKDKICPTCKEFLKWKHKEKFLKHIKKLKKYFSKNSNSIKFGANR